MQTSIKIHELALNASAAYKNAEADLLEILQKIDERSLYLEFECKSLYEYTTKELKLSESIAYNFIVVARKAHEVPQLKDAIRSGALSVSKARKITPVINAKNQENWIKLAIEQPQRKLEQEVARANPKEAVPERLKFVSGDRLNLQLGISECISLKLKRAQDIESQRMQKAATIEETLEASLDVYLEKNDPLVKSERLYSRKHAQPVARQVHKRDKGQCTYKNKEGKRCEDRRWLDIHHIIPKSLGGDDSLENMTTLCAAHHKMLHRQ